MRRKLATLLPAFLCFLTSFVFTCADSVAQTASAPARITQAVDEENLVTLKGNVHPLARAEFDRGAVSNSQPLHRMLLLLQRSPAQEAALEKLLDDQQSKSSPNYHAWLTPAQFGQQFGPADADMQAVTNWLQAHGFQITDVTAGRTVIEFSGSAAQVRNAFHTEMHQYQVNGEAHLANGTDPQIPAALAPVVAGVVSLNNFPVASHMKRLGTFQRSTKTGLTTPLFTFPGCSPGNCFALGPADFATIYNSAPLLSGTPKIDGTGQTIAIVGESDINPTDVLDFQTMFGMTPNFVASNIIVNGADPGINDSEGESDLDVQWASAVAPGATVKFVTSESTETTAGIFLSAVYIVENNLAGVMSESFGACEQQIGSLNPFHNALWQQAATQGITVILSAGDGGSAGCDNFDTAQTATGGLAVSGFASTPYNIVVGGTDFDEVNRWSQFWSTTNNATNQSSALGYIPEIPWNNSCAQLGFTACGASAPQGSLNIVAGSGGASVLYPKPSWQLGALGVPNDAHRDLPDVSLFASNGFNGTFYTLCQKDVTGVPSCNLSNFGFTFQGVGGTSAAAPAFAGIMALVNQSQATAQNPAPRQGNANYVLYSLFKKQTNASPALNCNASATPSSSCTFYDVTRGNSALANSTTGTNDVPCSGSSPNCSSKNVGVNGVLATAASPTTLAYSTTAGYDLATGLGSVNVANLVSNWSSVTSLPSTTTLSAKVSGNSVTSITGIVHGTPVSVTANVAAGSGSTTPSGQVALAATPNPNAGSASPSLDFAVLNLASGAATGPNVILPGGQYNLTAHYQGDGTFGSSDSPGISVNISAEPSKTLITIPTFNPSTGAETGNMPTTLVYGSAYIARIDVGNANATLVALCAPPVCPTGTIAWTDALNGAAAVPLDGGTFTLNSSGYTEDQPINITGGSHVLTASYSGDKSFAPSTATYTIAITPAPTVSAFTNNPVPIVGVPVTMNVVGGPDLRTGIAPTGTVSIFDGSTLIGGPVAVVPDAPSTGFPSDFSAAVAITYSTGGTHQITAKYSGDPNYAPSTSTVLAVPVLLPTSTSLSVNSANITYGVNTVLTATVTTNSKSPALSGSVIFFGGLGPGGSTQTQAVSTDANGNTMLVATLTTVLSGSQTFSAGYNNDPAYAGSTSQPIAITVNIPDFSLGPSGGFSLTPVAGQSGTAQFTVTPASQTPSTVNLSFNAQTISGYTVSLASQQVNLNGSPVNVALVMTPVTTSSSANLKLHHAAVLAPVNRRSPWSPELLALAAIFVLITGASRRRARPLMSATLACAVAFATSCGGGSGGTAPPPPPPPPQSHPTSITLSTSNAKVAQGQPFTVTATVTSTSSQPLNGTVTFYSFGIPVTVALPLVNGQAQAQQGPSLFYPGLYSITAAYSGDTNNNADSVSSQLTQVITGTVPGTILANTGVDNHSLQVMFGVQ